MRVLAQIIAIVLCLACIAQPGQTRSEEQAIPSPTIFRNESFKLTYELPAGWHLLGDEIKERMQGSSKTLQVLLVAGERREFGPPAVVMVDENLNKPNQVVKINTDKYLQAYGRNVSNFVPIEPEKPAAPGLLRAGGLSFSRQDFRRLGEEPYFMAVLVTARYGHVLRLAIHGTSKGEVDDLAKKALRSLRFDPEWGTDPGPNDCASECNEPVVVTRSMSQGRLLTENAPDYPERARLNRISGEVVMNAAINEDGKVVALWIVSGHPWLADAAIDAVKDWKFKPWALNGVPTPVHTTISVNFEQR